MASWTKKITKSVGSDLEPGETLRGGMIVQPAGMMRAMMAREVGGLVGTAIAKRFGDDASLASDHGTAAMLTEGPLVLGITDRRVIAWTWAKLTGKPKDFHCAIPLDAIADIEIEKKTASHAFAMLFNDGTGRIYEAPKVGNDTEAFVEAFKKSR